MTNGNQWIYGNPVHDSDGLTVGTTNGLTKREYVAACAMQGLCANGFGAPADAAIRAVGIADALIAALNAPQPSDTDGSGK